MINLEEELKKLPDKPGVYIMHDKHDTIIYVGKAKILKNRVDNIFRVIKIIRQKLSRWFHILHILSIS